MPDVSIPSVISCSPSQCSHSFYNQIISTSNHGYDKFSPKIKPIDYVQTGFLMGIKTMKDDIEFETAEHSVGDDITFTLEQLSFKIVLSYRGNNNLQS